MMPEEPIPLESVRDLQGKVEALSRALVGGQARRDGRVVQGGERGLDNALCADGFDAAEGTHKNPKLSRRAVLDKFSDAVSKLDEVARKSTELFGPFTNAVLVPRELSHAPSEIPDSMVCINLPELTEHNARLRSKAVGSMSFDVEPANVPESMLRAVEASEALVKVAVQEMHKTLKKGGRGLKRPARRVAELGWSDAEAEKTIISLLLASPGAARLVREGQVLGLKGGDFEDRENEKLWEACERLGKAGQLRDETTSMDLVARLKKEAVTDNARITRMEQVGKKSLQSEDRPDTEELFRALVFKGRLRRLYGAVATGKGLKVDLALQYQQQQQAHAAAAGRGVQPGVGVQQQQLQQQQARTQPGGGMQQQQQQMRMQPGQSQMQGAVQQGAVGGRPMPGQPMQMQQPGQDRTAPPMRQVRPMQ